MSFQSEKLNNNINYIDKMSIINPNKCIARKNMTSGINIQCTCKRKYGEFCGRHYRNKNRESYRIDKPLSNLKNEIIKKGKIINDNILINYTSITPTHNTYLKKYYVSDFKYSLKTYGLSTKGKKAVLSERLYNFLKNIKYCVNNIKKVVLIQSLFRMKLVKNKIRMYGPAIFNIKICNNKTDFFTLDDINKIPKEYFYSYKDHCNFVYGFDIRSIYKLIQLHQPNPYTRESFGNDVITTINKRIEYLKKNKKLIQFEQPKLTIEQELRNKVVTIFQKIDELGNHTNSEWFFNLSIPYLKRYYRILEELWKYRAQLTMEARLRIVPNDNVFRTSYRYIYRLHNLNKIRNIILTEIDKLISSGINQEEKTLGSLYVLTGLTEVSRECAESLPWLVQ